MLVPKEQCPIYVMQTLSDPELRLAYDGISGFDEEAINPFVDTSYPSDKVRTTVAWRNKCQK